MKPVDVKSGNQAEYNINSNGKDPKFQVGNHVTIPNYKNFFAKGYTPNQSEEIFVIKEVKNTVPWTYGINDLNDKKIIGPFFEKEQQKTNQQKFRIEKVIKRKWNKPYVKCSWIYKNVAE